MMTCEQARERILASLDDGPALRADPDVEIHTASCAECRRFSRLQMDLDARLAAALPPAFPASDFRSAVKRRIRQDPTRSWPDFLPDLAHLTGCAAGLTVLIFLLPQYSGDVIAGGGAFTVLTYLL